MMTDAEREYFKTAKAFNIELLRFYVKFADVLGENEFERLMNEVLDEISRLNKILKK
jgi:hypothetical protein